MAGGVFISYSQADSGCAFELVARLEGQGIDCWIAPRDITPSADWASEIMDAITAARVMILVFSASSNNSPQVRREVERAVHKQLSILPFRIEHVLPSKSLEFFLSTQHWMDAFPPPREPHYARLCSYLKAQLAMETASAAPPAAAGGIAHGFDTTDLLHIERQLAGYIGPLAKHLVKAAASTARGMDDLVERLATELESESERRDFAQRCRTK
jgi:TIR domain